MTRVPKSPSPGRASAAHGSPATAPPRLDDQPWLNDPALGAVFRALASGGHEARAVGGAVRNALLGRPIVDVDLATPARPEEVMRLAAAAGLHAIPTGFEHGTVTVVSSHVPFEVTTLRRDIETFGRHARVTFSTDWAEDAARRDFTLNALYCSADGQVHDPLGGLPDLAAQRVRFIGDAAARIREDYLRILRFFRFTAEYAEGDPDAAGLDACIAGADGIAGLSGERLRAEMLKLLAAPRAVPVLEVMDRVGILARIVGQSIDLAAIARLVAIDEALNRAPDPALRLACLAVKTPQSAAALRERLKLSNAEAAILARAAEPASEVAPPAPEQAAKGYIYQHGAEALTSVLLLAWARSGAGVDDRAWRDRLALPERFPRPVLPVRGSDVLALGVTPGPEVGLVLEAFERWWMATGFPADETASRDRLREIVSGRPSAPD